MLHNRLCAPPSFLVSLWPLAAQQHRPSAGHSRAIARAMLAQPCGSVFELAEAWPEVCAATGPEAAVIDRVLQVTASRAQCRMTDQSKSKHGDLEQQLVVSFTNRITHEQVRQLLPQDDTPKAQLIITC